MRKVTYANVVSTLALFIALGGASYAAVKLPRNSVGRNQLRNGAVTTKKINKTTRAELRGKAGAPGPTGPRGANGANGTNGTNGTNGAPGPAGPSDVSVTSADYLALPVNTQKQVVSVTVPAGSYVLQAKTWLRNQGAGEVGCDLINGADSSFPSGYFDQASATFKGDTTMVLVGAAIFTQSTTIVLRCDASTSDAAAIDTRLTATATGAVRGTLPLGLYD